MSCPNDYVSIKKYNDPDFLYYTIRLNGEYWLEKDVARKECDKNLECDGLLYNSSNERFQMRKGMKLNHEFYENPSSKSMFCVKKDMMLNSPDDSSMTHFKSVPHKSFNLEASIMDVKKEEKRIRCDPKTTILSDDGVCVSNVEKIVCDPTTGVLEDGVCVPIEKIGNEKISWPLILFKLAIS